MARGVWVAASAVLHVLTLSLLFQTRSQMPSGAVETVARHGRRLQQVRGFEFDFRAAPPHDAMRRPNQM